MSFKVKSIHTHKNVNESDHYTYGGGLILAVLLMWIFDYIYSQ